jgi:hypothetical protein
MKQMEAREAKGVGEGRVCSGVLCLERVRVMRGLRSNHGSSLDVRVPRVHNAREKHKR